MATYRVYKETAMPGSLTPHSIYLIAPPGAPEYVEMYVTGAEASTVKRMINRSDVQTMIDNAVAGAVGDDNHIVDTIAQRDALTPKTNGMQVYVITASGADGDPTVASGGATYMWRTSTNSWIKISEAESMDVSLTWAALTGKPTSTPAQIDAAVSASHSHDNKTQLDKVGEDGGNFTYGGQLPVIAWSSEAW